MGTPAFGKSTVAKALMQRFEKACTFRWITCIRWLCQAYRIWVLKFHPPPYSSCAWLEKAPQAWHKMIRTTNLQLPQMTFGYGENQTGYRRKKLVNASHGSCCFLNLATTPKCLHPRNPKEASLSTCSNKPFSNCTQKSKHIQIPMGWSLTRVHTVSKSPDCLLKVSACSP
jgi:hypothetical protein